MLLIKMKKISYLRLFLQFLKTGSISFGIDFVAGKNLVPRPPTGKIALRIFLESFFI